MLNPSVPDNEALRLRALRKLNILDTGPEERFDRITRLAKRLFGVPTVLISLIDVDRQWFKSRQGLDVTETGRDVSFCGHAILENETLSIPNALEDSRFADNPYVVSGPKIRFYAGAQLRSDDNFNLGTLCLIDQSPRVLSDEEKQILRDLADLVEQELSRGELLNLSAQLNAAWQEAEVAKHQAEKANKLKDKFVSLVAHDLHSPIGGIQGLSEFVLSNPKGTIDEGSRSSIEFIFNQSRQLISMLDKLLDLSRLQTGKIEVTPTFCDAHYVANDAISRLWQQAKLKNVTFVNDIPERTRIYADIHLFGQVLQNVLSNAIKFSYEGKDIGLFVPDDFPTSIAIKDIGVGISPHRVDKLFSLEEKVSTSGTAGEIGTGFGLPLSYQLVQAHDGDIRVETCEGQGSTFFINLPTIKPKVLIVEDDTDMRDLLTAFLQPEDVLIEEADNGRSALDAMLREAPHLVILDINMPEMDGMELLREMKQIPGLREVPIIVLTVLNSDGIRDQCLRLGAADFTQKPIVVEDFMPRVRNIIG